jgi:peptidoglycan hydrolase CwlO-like protein
MNKDQMTHEIKWLENKIDEISQQLTKKPSKIKHIKCLERQIKEINLRLTFENFSV